MRRRRGSVPDKRLTDGPAKLCEAFAIDMRRYGADVARIWRGYGAPGGLAIMAGGAQDLPIVASPRVGISVARDWPLRYRLAGSPPLTGRPQSL